MRVRRRYRRTAEADDDAGASFDSLLDTMTNVVGILVVLLVVTQLGVRDAMRQIQNALPAVTEADLRHAQEQAAGVRAELAELGARREALLHDYAAQEREVARLRPLVDDARRRLARMRADRPSSGNVEERIHALQDDLKKVETTAAQTRDALEASKKRLEATPIRKEPPALVVRLPSPRPAPPGAPCFWFMCSGNRVAYINNGEMVQLAKKRIETMARQLAADGQTVPLVSGLRKPGQPANPLKDLIYDGDKIVEYFKKRDVGSPEFRLLFYLTDRRHESLHVVMRPNRGETPRSLPYPTSKYRVLLREVQDANGYVRFAVCPDSFEAYTVAREVLERYYDLPAGWSLFGEPRMLISGNMGLKIEGKTWPKPPPAGSKPPPPAPPPKVLD